MNSSAFGPKEDGINLSRLPPLRYTCPKVNTVGSRMPPTFTSERIQWQRQRHRKRQIKSIGSRMPHSHLKREKHANIVYNKKWQIFGADVYSLFLPAISSWKCGASFIVLGTTKKVWSYYTRQILDNSCDPDTSFHVSPFVNVYWILDSLPALFGN